MNEIVVLGEGRINRIDLDLIDASDPCLMDSDKPDSPVLLDFYDQDVKYYLRIYDHRDESRRAYMEGTNGEFAAAFKKTPCLCGFRKKGATLYCVLADIGTADIRDNKEEFILTKVRTFNRIELRVIGGTENKPAMHPATGICLVEPRPAKD